MIENSFPAQGSLSRITKRCPEAVQWIVRKANGRHGHALRFGRGDAPGLARRVGSPRSLPREAGRLALPRRPARARLPRGRRTARRRSGRPRRGTPARAPGSARGPGPRGPGGLRPPAHAPRPPRPPRVDVRGRVRRAVHGIVLLAGRDVRRPPRPPRPPTVSAWVISPPSSSPTAATKRSIHIPALPRGQRRGAPGAALDEADRGAPRCAKRRGPRDPDASTSSRPPENPSCSAPCNGPWNPRGYLVLGRSGGTQDATPWTEDEMQLVAAARMAKGLSRPRGPRSRTAPRGLPRPPGPRRRPRLARPRPGRGPSAVPLRRPAHPRRGHGRHVRADKRSVDVPLSAARSLVPQGLDRVHGGGAPGRVEAEDDADAR